MSQTIPFAEIEPKWREKWAQTGAHQAPNPTSQNPPYFILVMFPYPSGNLHMGHVRNYTIGDVLARFHRKKGRSVLHPIGWDSFGLPAENAAIQRQTHPAKWTWANIDNMRGQLKQLGISYDWDREVATCSPDYYRWNQWIFIKMFEKGLAYQKKAPVNWCPTDQTVLANEQVQDGKCWRCDSDVVQKELTQWFFKITDYAQELLDGHDELAPNSKQKGWPEQVLSMQKNWIGRSEGAYVDFHLSDLKENITVFTTRPDTLFGATFMVLAPEHPLVDQITTTEKKAAVESYREQAKSRTKFERTAENREKTGEFTGAYATNPVNGAKTPIWIADYVLTDYGTGAIMAVPAHDERDFAFAKKFNLSIIPVIQPKGETTQSPMEQAFTGMGEMINSGSFDGQNSSEAKANITQWLEKEGKGKRAITYKLRDWLLSRQRYWGTPIPMVYCEKCGVSPVKETDLPVVLPENVEFKGEGKSPLAQAEDWINVPCPQCAGPAKRETDTMDTFVDSSWYYARYVDPKNETAPVSLEESSKWLPVTQYVGGIEHACMHLIYSRFFHKVLRDFKLVSGNEPFSSLLTQGMVTLGGKAMSKSRGNVVDPGEVIQKYGADACRLFILFAAPPRQQLEWSDNQVEGVWRFLNRLWRVSLPFSPDGDLESFKKNFDPGDKPISKEELIRQTHVSIKRVTEDIEDDFGFNTAISAIMELVNALYRYPHIGDDASRQAVESALHLLSPFAPHMTEELWERLGLEGQASSAPWPVFDPGSLKAKELQIIIQVNGKVREKILVAASAKEEDVKSQAQEALEKKGMPLKPKRVIYIPNKLVNFVVQPN